MTIIKDIYLNIHLANFYLQNEIKLNFRAELTNLILVK